MSEGRFPRELIQASAGTGKTFRISSRIIGLLAEGVPPDRILASTFTRKAAGEILGRVLFRLAEAALEPEAARELAGHAALPGASAGDLRLETGDALELLDGLVRELHRIDVGTLDALFVRMARTFGLELGLPPGWRIADEPLRDRLRSEAVQDVLRSEDPEILVELLRMLARGEARRRVHERLVEDVDRLRDLHRQTAPGADEPWSPFRPREAPDDGEARRRELADRIARLDAPLNADGSPDSRWVPELERASEALREGRWEDLWSKGVGEKALQGEPTYYGKRFPQGLAECLGEARELASAELESAYGDQARAMGRIARRYGEALTARQRKVGAYGFGDITHLLGGPEPVGGRNDLHHRLDRRTEHVLLDEFQDTSLPQWEALRPLVDDVAASGRGDGSTVVVADPKQSIYGWRGADPELVHRLGRRYDLERGRLDVSWRSSPVVLDFVNRLFGDVASNPVLGEVDRGRAVAAEWAEAFDEHRPAPARREEAGYVRVEAGPKDAGSGTDRPALMAKAAERVARLHADAPGARIGVLTYRNKTVARLIHELRRRGIEASEEGGTPVDDAAPVAAVLALLRLADHPGHLVARYHVARTPLGRVVGYRDHRDDSAARRLALRVRRRLLRNGYGDTLSRWAEELASAVSGSELRRLEQLVELGFAWEGRATLRPSEFVRFVEGQRVEDPLSAPVRVMTVHQAKGLEFDVVVLPELDDSIVGGGREAAVPERDPDTGRVQRVFPAVRKELRPLFPEMETAIRQRDARGLRDALSWLYVGVTRARHAVHLMMAADEGPDTSGARSFARLVRAAFDRHDEPVEEGACVLEMGDRDWWREVEGMEGRGPAPEAAAGELELRIDPAAPRTRMLGRRTPSDLEGGGEVDLSRVLGLEDEGGLQRGRVIHAWCQEIRWIEDGLPGADHLRRAARRAVPEVTDAQLDRLLRRFREWMAAPAVRRALSREEAEERGREVAGRDVELELVAERPFAHRSGEEVVSGVIDRLVLLRGPDGYLDGAVPVAAEVVDFKTDSLEPDDREGLKERTDYYRPQVTAYCGAVAGIFGLEPEAVSGRLVFLAPGVVREL